MSSRQRGGFGGGRRVVVNTRGNGGGVSTLNERFTQLKKQASNVTTARRVSTNVRASQNRFSSVMSRRTGQAPPARAVANLGGQRLRGGRGGARGGLRGGRGGRTQSVGRTFAGRPVSRRGGAAGGRGGRGGRGRGRGGRGGRDKRPVSKDDLDKDLDIYMGGSKKSLDDELDAMQTERSTA